MSRAGDFIGAALVWTVLAVAAAVLFVVGLPLLAVAAVLRTVYELGSPLFRRGEMSGADDLDDVLRARIDGDDDADLLGCGCLRDEQPETGCTRCDWVTCYDHQFGPHLCERDAAVEAFNINPRGDAVSLDQRLDVMGAALLGEIYEYLESQR